MTESIEHGESRLRIRGNDYSILPVPHVGEWKPRLSVSVVIPAYDAQEKLDLTLAGLAGQTYPSHLLEVVVVDDGTNPPLRLPAIVPENVRLVQSIPGGWGRAHACHSGAKAAEGDVIHWLDSDMVLFSEHVEAQMRWHHLAEYLVVLGYKRFVDFAPGQLSPQAVLDAVVAGSAESLFDIEQSERHEWVEQIIDESDGLSRGGSRLYRVHVGATASVPSTLLWAAGGMDNSIVLGEDTDLGFRLAQQGAVFVPDPEARSWHLGASTVMRRREQVARHNEPFMGHLLPMRRDWRRWIGRQWLVPYVDVVVDARQSSYEDVRASVGGALASTLPDVCVTVVGPWSELTDERRSPLDDPLLDLRSVRAAFMPDSRVSFVESLPPTSAPTPFRLICPPGWVPSADALQRLIELAEAEDFGLILLAAAGDSGLTVGRFERTAAIARAVALRGDGEDLDDLVHEMFGTHWIDGAEWALIPAETTPKAISISAVQGQAQKWKREADRWQREAQRREQDALQWEQKAVELEKRVEALAGNGLTRALRQLFSRR